MSNDSVEIKNDRQRITRLHSVNIPLFSQSNGRVTNTALRKLHTELEHSRRPDFSTECSCKTLTTMGYPCGHYLQQCIASGTPVPLLLVHRHWSFESLDPGRPHSSPERVIREPALPLARRQGQHNERGSDAEVSSEIEVSESVDEEDDESISSMVSGIVRRAQTETEHEALLVACRMVAAELYREARKDLVSLSYREAKVLY
jgi:hypothetical protein